MGQAQSPSLQNLKQMRFMDVEYGNESQQNDLFKTDEEAPWLLFVIPISIKGSTGLWRSTLGQVCSSFREAALL